MDWIIINEENGLYVPKNVPWKVRELPSFIYTSLSLSIESFILIMSLSCDCLGIFEEFTAVLL